jgi:hypothetical protein
VTELAASSQNPVDVLFVAVRNCDCETGEERVLKFTCATALARITEPLPAADPRWA